MSDQVVCEKAGTCGNKTCKHRKGHETIVVVGLGRPSPLVNCTKDADCDHIKKICRCRPAK
jgi:hypothetical protein